MQLFHLHPGTGELVGTSAARESPMQPGEFLIPAHATTIAPPKAIEGSARVFAGGEWLHIVDRRGETWWREDGSAVVVSDLGDPADDGLLDEAPPAPPEPEVAPRPRCVAAAFDIAVIDGDVATIDTGAGISAGFGLGDGSFMLFFALPQPDANYVVKVTCFEARFTTVAKAEDSIIIAADEGAPVSFSIEIWRVV